MIKTYLSKFKYNVYTSPDSHTANVALRESSKAMGLMVY